MDDRDHRILLVGYLHGVSETAKRIAKSLGDFSPELKRMTDGIDRMVKGQLDQLPEVNSELKESFLANFESEKMSFDEYQAERQREEDARQERKSIEIYRAAVQIYTLLRTCAGPHLGTIPANKDEMHEAVREAIELWDAVERTVG
jgi:hypothetical protein